MNNSNRLEKAKQEAQKAKQQAELCIELVDKVQNTKLKFKEIKEQYLKEQMEIIKILKEDGASNDELLEFRSEVIEDLKSCAYSEEEILSYSEC